MVVKALPNHQRGGRWQMPTGSTRRHMQPFPIVILMARTALYDERAVSSRATAHLHRVPVTIVSLPRKVAGRMAIHAARVMEDGNDRFESGSGSSVVAFIILPFIDLSRDLKEQTADKTEYDSSSGYERREFSPCDS